MTSERYSTDMHETYIINVEILMLFATRSSLRQDIDLLKGIHSRFQLGKRKHGAFCDKGRSRTIYAIRRRRLCWELFSSVFSREHFHTLNSFKRNFTSIYCFQIQSQYIRMKTSNSFSTVKCGLSISDYTWRAARFAMSHRT